MTCGVTENVSADDTRKACDTDAAFQRGTWKGRGVCPNLDRSRCVDADALILPFGGRWIHTFLSNWGVGGIVEFDHLAGCGVGSMSLVSMVLCRVWE